MALVMIAMLFMLKEQLLNEDETPFKWRSDAENDNPQSNHKRESSFYVPLVNGKLY